MRLNLIQTSNQKVGPEAHGYLFEKIKEDTRELGRPELVMQEHVVGMSIRKVIKRNKEEIDDY